ncbi:peptidase M48 [Pueribacillus theae]|uniref:Peptidase M48 n=1 Tax=Pueribacillus theae TaxID=2171751 RepID=A0A2U1JV34_9BACI|nr:M48 family metallopeptidase [Pueribacillus theae]PWA09071.1 peptidase M48 [Pueribacillus theae]
MFYYLYVGSDNTIPTSFEGTAADPKLFMTKEEQILSTDFSRLKNLLFFLSIPVDWMIYLFVLIFGISVYFNRLSKEVTRFFFLQSALYVFLLSLVSSVISFPLSYISRKVSLEYGITSQSFTGWMRDYTISFWVSFIMTALTVWVIYIFMRRNEKRWWFHVWLISIPFTVFLMFIQPVVIDPLYNDFYSLKDKELETKILELADRADIPAEHVYEVNMSEKTNALNAYVTGIGSNLRIVLWDTTLNKLEDEETLFVMAHEIGHYVKHHLYLNVIGSIVLTFFGLYFGSKLFHFMLNRYGERLSIRRHNELASLPVLLLIFSLLSFAASPITNAVSRYHEHEADVYAIEMTQDKEAAIHAFQKLTATGLSEVNPPLLVKWLRYGHPTMLERLVFLETYE